MTKRKDKGKTPGEKGLGSPDLTLPEETGVELVAGEILPRDEGNTGADQADQISTEALPENEEAGFTPGSAPELSSGGIGEDSASIIADLDEEKGEGLPPEGETFPEDEPIRLPEDTDDDDFAKLFADLDEEKGEGLPSEDETVPEDQSIRLPEEPEPPVLSDEERMEEALSRRYNLFPATSKKLRELLNKMERLSDNFFDQFVRFLDSINNNDFQKDEILQALRRIPVFTNTDELTGRAEKLLPGVSPEEFFQLHKEADELCPGLFIKFLEFLPDEKAEKPEAPTEAPAPEKKPDDSIPGKPAKESLWERAKKCFASWLPKRKKSERQPKVPKPKEPKPTTPAPEKQKLGGKPSTEIGGEKSSKSGGKRKVVIYLILILLVAIASGLYFRSCGKDKPVKTPLSAAAGITSFAIPNQVGDLAVDGNKITAKVKFGEDLTEVAPVIGVSDRAKIVPASGTPQDFSDGPVTYIVTAEDSTVQKFEVTVLMEKMSVSLGLISPGDGPEHSVLKQVKAYPVYFGFTGDPNNAVAVEKYAGGFTHRLAIKCGYVKFEDGKEMRIARPGELYFAVKGKDGDYSIVEYAGEGDYENNNPSDINPAASTFATAKFAGDKGNEDHVQSYEYVYDPYTDSKELEKDSQTKSVGEVGKIVGSGNVTSEIEPIILSESVSLPAVFCPSLS